MFRYHIWVILHICLSPSDISLRMIISSFIHVATNGIISFFFCGWVIFHCNMHTYIHTYIWKWKSLSRVWLFVNPTDCNLIGSSSRGILQARLLAWVAVAFSRGSSQPSHQTQVSCITGGFFTLWITREARYMYTYMHSFFIQSCVHGHLGCLHVLAIINSAAANTRVHVS